MVLKTEGEKVAFCFNCPNLEPVTSEVTREEGRGRKEEEEEGVRRMISRFRFNEFALPGFIHDFACTKKIRR